MVKPVALVTGGAGFIGSHVAQELINKGIEVIILDDLSGGFKRNIPASATFLKGSITDSGLIHELFTQHKIDYVFHLAAYAAEGLSHFIRKFNYSNNVIGSVNLINASVKNNIKQFVFTSSIAVYGSGQIPFTEASTPQPEDPYGIAKYTVELDLKAAHQQFGLNYTIFRPHNVYGIRQNLSDPYRNVIGIFMRSMLNNQPLPVFGNGEQTRAFTPINTVVDQICESIKNPSCLNQIINTGHDYAISINNLIKTLSEIAELKLEVKHLEARNEVLNAVSDHTRANNTFKNLPNTTIEEALLEMWQWAKQLDIAPPKKFEEIELEKYMPTNWR